MRKILLCVAAGVLLAGAPRAAAADNPAASAPLAPPVVFPGGWLLKLGAADRALELGFPSTAADLYRELLAAPEAPAGERHRVTLALATALLNDGRLDDAQAALNGGPGPRDAAWQLRAGLIAVQQQRLDAAKAAAAAVKPEELGAADRGWDFLLQAMLADAGGDLDRAGKFYDQAMTAAVSDLARARFVLGKMQAQLRFNHATDQDLATLRKNADQYQGQSIGYKFALQYAVALAALGRRDDAVAVLQRQLLQLPPEEKDVNDDSRLLLGLIAGPDSGVGRNALGSLLASAASRDKQRVALQLLARASAQGAARDQFRAQLDQLIGAPSPSPILEDLLVCRAQLALVEKSYGRAEDDAKALLQKFPGSPLKASALGVLTGTAWELRRYRTAADDIAQIRALLPPGENRAALGVLLAEAYFHAQDFRSAADAYAAALREPPAGIATGLLMFQRVQAEIDAGRLDRAQQVLDELARDPRFDAVNRWEAEWNLARALQAAGQTADAYARVSRLLVAPDTGAAALPAALRVRMLWLQARLSFESGQPAATLTQTDALQAWLAGPAGAGLGAALTAEVKSTAVLLKAQAEFALDRAPGALALLQTLRADYPQSDAAVYSYVAEAGYYSSKNEIVEAQRLLIKLADTFKDNAYAPYALYEAALNAEKRGQDVYYQEAYTLLERLVREYPRSDLVFYARLKQGDLLRKLNQFGAAQQVYELLVNNFPEHQDVRLAELALADCHLAQSANDPSHFESATTIYERLADLPNTPVDMKVEAGFKLGYALEKHGKPGRAQAVLWPVVNDCLLDAAKAAQLGARGRYWMSRTLLELGGLYEQQAKLDEARRAYELLLKENLPGGDLARAKLARFNLPATAKP